MLIALTSLALIAIAIHTKYIYARAMEDMLAESRQQADREPRTVVALDRRFKPRG
jgi:hypothetical protein